MASSDEEVAQRTTLELAEQLQRDFKDRDHLYQDIDDVLHQRLPVNIPEGYRKTAIEVRTNLALRDVQKVAAALSVNSPSVSFRPVGFGDVYQQNSTRRERFFEAAWSRQESEARRQLVRTFLWSLISKGEGILKTCERATAAWSTYSADAAAYQQQLEQDGLDQHAQDLAYDAHTEQLRLQLPYPIATTDVPPETFYYTKNENGYTAVVEIKDVPYLEALERFGASLDKSGNVRSPSDTGEIDPRAAELARAEWSHVMKSARTTTLRCIEAWDSSVQVVLLQGPNQLTRSGSAALCRVTRHSYGDPLLKTLRGPYFHALGLTTDSRLPEHAGLSILYGYLPLFKLLDSLLTIEGNSAYMTGFATFKSAAPPGSVAGLPQPPYGNDLREQGAAQKIEPGKLYPFDISPVDQPHAGIDFQHMLQNVQQLLDQVVPPTFSGAVGADSSGYALNQAAYLAGLAFNPIVANAEVALSERTGFESWLIQNRISETVYAWGEQDPKKGSKRQGGTQTRGTWLSIGPDDLDGIHRYQVKLSPSTPSNEIIRIRSIGEKMQLKLITYEDAVTEAGANPDEVEKSWLLHDLKQSPEIQQQLKDQVFQKLGTIQQQRIAASGVNVQEMAGGLPGGGPPQLPGGPPVGMPLGPPTGMPGTLGTPPSGGLGGMPTNPVPSPGRGLPLVPPGPGGGGAVSGTPMVPGPPPGSLRLPGQ